jgi:hypothetical protein
MDPEARHQSRRMAAARSSSNCKAIPFSPVKTLMQVIGNGVAKPALNSKAVRMIPVHKPEEQKRIII